MNEVSYFIRDKNGKVITNLDILSPCPYFEKKIIAFYMCRNCERKDKCEVAQYLIGKELLFIN